MQAKIQMVKLDPRAREATIMLGLENGASIQIHDMPFDPPAGIAYDQTDQAAVEEAVRLLNSLTPG